MPFTLFNSPLGPLAIGFTSEAITKISFESPGQEMTVEKDFPPVLKTCLQELTNYFEGTNFTFSFNNDQPGTDFQKKVWSALCEVKAGDTQSYMQLSKRLQNPLAIRAVANANGKNDLAIVVPCHRIIGSDGSLTGYAGGLWRKKWLLDHEAKYLRGSQTLF